MGKFGGNKMAGRIERFADKIGCASEGFKSLAIYAVIGLIIFLTINVVLRYFFARPLVFTEEVTGYFLAFIVFMGMGYTLRVGGHVITDVLVRNFSAKTQKALRVPILLGGVIFATFLVISAWMLMIKNYLRGNIDFGSLGTPDWIPNLIFVIGSACFFLEMIALLYHAMRRE